MLDVKINLIKHTKNGLWEDLIFHAKFWRRLSKID